MTELRLAFADLQELFMKKNPNGKIEKSGGIVKVWFDAKYKNQYYKYNGSLLEIAKKLNLDINNQYTVYTPVTPVVVDRQKGNISVSSEDMGYWSQNGSVEMNYIIENGKIKLLSEGRGMKELKVYQTKKGYYFNLNSKRYNVEIA